MQRGYCLFWGTLLKLMPRDQPHVIKMIHVAGLTRLWTPSLPANERASEREREYTLRALGGCPFAGGVFPIKPQASKQNTRAACELRFGRRDRIRHLHQFSLCVEMDVAVACAHAVSRSFTC